MEKSETMKKFEKETDIDAIIPAWAAIHDVERDEICNPEYTSYLERQLEEAQAKAESYDRLMSGGKKTLKEWANLLHRPVAIDFGGVAESFSSIPMRWDSAGYWYCDENAEDFEDEHFIIPEDVVDYTGSWQASLTLPDGWEEASK